MESPETAFDDTKETRPSSIVFFVADFYGEKGMFISGSVRIQTLTHIVNLI